jgi:hypothetical protein
VRLWTPSLAMMAHTWVLAVLGLTRRAVAIWASLWPVDRAGVRTEVLDGLGYGWTAQDPAGEAMVRTRL